MTSKRASRRQFLKTSAVAAAGVTVPYFFTGAKGIADDAKAQSKNDRPMLGCIGTGDRWKADGPNAMQFADCVAVCDVDANHAAEGKETQGRSRKATSTVHEDYRKILDRKDIDVVTIVTPDHWHSKIAIEAMQAGKDVYCEKPLTLTIDEGKQICKVLKETDRVFQVGTQQRSEMGQRFLKAVGLIRDGRIGDVKKVHLRHRRCHRQRPHPEGRAVPKSLNWEMWLGQAPLVDYASRRAAAGAKPLPLRVPLVVRILRRQDDRLGCAPRRHRPVGHRPERRRPGPDRHRCPSMAKHPVPFKNGMPTRTIATTTPPRSSQCSVNFPGGVEM